MQIMWKVCKTLVWVISFQLVRFFFITCQQIWWSVNGVSKQLKRISSGEELAKVAHIQNVLYAERDDMSVPEKCFILSHSHFARADYVLKPSVSLLTIYGDRAIFVEVPPHINLYDGRKHPFFGDSQKRHAEQLISMPIRAMMELSEQLGCGTCKAVWIFHSVRCGSTAMAQTFNCLPYWMTMAESLFNQEYISGLAERHQDLTAYTQSEEFHCISECMIRMCMKDVPENCRLCIKMTGVLDWYLVPIIKERFAHHQMIFMYRSCELSLLSAYRSFSCYSGIYDIALMIRNWSRQNTIAKITETTCSNGLQDKLDWYFEQKLTLFELFFTIWCTNIIRYKEATDQGYALAPVNYASLISNPGDTIAKLFKLCEIEQYNVHTAVQSLERDSQEGTILGRENARKQAKWMRDEGVVERCNQMLRHHDLPRFDENLILPNSI